MAADASALEPDLRIESDSEKKVVSLKLIETAGSYLFHFWITQKDNSIDQGQRYSSIALFQIVTEGNFLLIP